MDNSDSEKRLEKIFENVNNWLKFIELKNIAVLTLSATILTLASRLDFYNATLVYKIMIGVCVSVFSTTMLISLKSLFASLDKDDYCKLSNDTGKNIMFYGDLSKMIFHEFLSAYDVKYKNSSREIINGYTSVEEDLINQILINSRITMKKGKYFNRSIKIIFCGALIEIIMIVCVAIYFIF